MLTSKRIRHKKTQNHLMSYNKKRKRKRKEYFIYKSKNKIWRYKTEKKKYIFWPLNVSVVEKQTNKQKTKSSDVIWYKKRKKKVLFLHIRVKRLLFPGRCHKAKYKPITGPQNSKCSPWTGQRPQYGLCNWVVRAWWNRSKRLNCSVCVTVSVCVFCVSMCV